MTNTARQIEIPLRQLTMVTSIASQQKRIFLNLTDNKEI